MLHDLSSRSTPPKLLPAFPIRYGPVILTPFAKQTSSRNTALRSLSSNTHLRMRNVTTMRHIVISLPDLNYPKFTSVHESDCCFFFFLRFRGLQYLEITTVERVDLEDYISNVRKRQSFKVYSMHVVQLCRLQSLLEIPADF